jgi:multiple sugar transport system substrate-binding protein
MLTRRRKAVRLERSFNDAISGGSRVTRLGGRLLAGVAALALTLGPATAEDIEFMTWTYTEETGQEPIQRMLDAFAEEHGITVEPLGYAWGEMGRNTFLRARSNTLPDVSQVQERFLPTFADLPQVVDLAEVYGAETLAETFAPGFLAMGEVNGRQIAVPWIGGTIGMVANTAVLEVAGVEGIPETMDEFRAALEAVRENVPNAVPYAMATMNNASIVLDYLVWVWTFGGEGVGEDGTMSVNSPEAVAALEFMTELVAERLAAPEIDRPDARRLFAQEVTAFYLDSPQARSFARQFSGEGEAYDANVLPITVPVLEAGATPTSIQWGHVLTIYSGEEVTAESPAAQFVMHLVSDEMLVDYAADQSVLPATQSGIESPRIAEDPYLSAWAAAAIDPRRNTIGALSNGAEVTDIIGEEVQAAILGQKSPQQAADDMQQRLEEAMANAG